MIYYISDLHFNHRRILSFERWNFKTIEEHDEKIMKVLERTLTSDDILYFLGDIGWPNEEICKRFLNLKCKKYMVVGNHDKKNNNFYKNILGFEEVYDYPIWLSNRIVISHYPIPVENGVINIHGHLHGSYLEYSNYVNVNIHMLDYKLFSQKQVNGLLSRLQKPSTKFLKEWFAECQIYTPEQREHRDDLIFNEDGRVIARKSL